MKKFMRSPFSTKEDLDDREASEKRVKVAHDEWLDELSNREKMRALPNYKGYDWGAVPKLRAVRGLGGQNVVPFMSRRDRLREGRF